MTVALLHNAVADDAPPDERDVLAQAELVGGALERLGRDARAVPVGLDLAALRARLAAERPELAFNLVEALGGSERLILAVPALLESLGLPYTGATLESLCLCADKVVAKRVMAAAGLPTPPWTEDLAAPAGLSGAQRAIVKSRWSHGSVGLEDDRIVPIDRLPAMREREGDLFAEAFVEGRELNLSVLGGARGPQVLPPAEIRFEGFGERPRIVGYRAKWDPESPEYRRTPRSFEFGPADARLLETVRELALAAWDCFRLRGWARVDFRVDAGGRPTVLEVNANPCLSPDAGFLAAAEQAGLDAAAVVARILEDAAVPARRRA